MEKDCSNCKFWNQEHLCLADDVADPGEYGECVRNPPQIMSHKPEHITLTCDKESAVIVHRLTRFPVTCCTTYCGEWKRNKNDAIYR